MKVKENTAVLLIGFGGPTSLDEVKPFLASVLEGVKVPQERIEEVYRHYEAVGGVSPYNEITLRQKRALEAELGSRGVKLPVLVGFRHASPGFEEVFLELKKKSAQKAVCFVLSSLRTYTSFEKYRDKLAEAQQRSNSSGLELVYTRPFHAHSLFVEAQANKVEQATDMIPPSERRKTFFIFSAHSVPVAMSDESGYASQFLESANLLAERLGLGHWMAAYQSRSGDPKDPWLGPDVKDILRAMDTSQFKNVVLIPSGFLSDNVEVVYDLDTEARETARSKGLNYFRASTVMDDPRFIRMMADQVLEIAG